MKTSNPGKRSVKAAAAFGAILLTAGCATSYDPMYAGVPKNLDAGVGQLLRYCSKFQDSGDLVTAAGLCDRAHRLEPRNPAPLMQLAEILKVMNQPDQAMAAYHAIIELEPRSTDARYALGKMYIARGEYDMAAAEFQTALRHKADDPRLYNALGVAHGLIGANESAMQAFTAGLEIAPTHISLRNNMGLVLVMNGRHEEGVRILEAVAADPAADETSHHNLQLAYGMVTAAKADAEASAAEQADSGFAQQSMAPVEPVMAEPVIAEPVIAETDRQMAAAAIPAPKSAAGGNAPVFLMPEPEPERAFATMGEVENPIEVTVREDSASASRSGNSPLRMQTARATTGDAVDANPPSAYMGAYLTADADIAAPKEKAMAPKASESQVAALQPMAPALSSGNYVVQFASYLSEARAMLGWSELRGNAPDLLDPVTPVVRRAELGEDRGTVYRLRTAPTAKTDAAALCTELKARGMDCLVVKVAPGGTQSGTRAG
ncbi:MAG: tetratricopeptide repeat protein [Kiloniellales bacterium]